MLKTDYDRYVSKAQNLGFNNTKPWGKYVVDLYQPKLSNDAMQDHINIAKKQGFQSVLITWHHGLTKVTFTITL